jgi:hypothetical protein
MTKKKVQEVTEVIETEVVIEESFDSGFCLANEERLELLYLDAVIKNLELSARLKDKDFNEAIQLLQKRIQELQSQKNIELNSLIEEKKTKLVELRNTKDKIETKYGFKLSECSFDEFTGRITIIPQ